MSDTNFMSYSDAETVVTGIADKYKTFKGTQAQWDALSLSEKVKYSFADITDDYAGTGVVDAVTNGDMNPVTSNAVYDALADLLSVQTTTGTDVAIAAGGYATTTINIAKTGYKPLGIVGTASSSASACIYDFRLTDNSAVFGLRNVGTASTTVKESVRVLYIKSS